MTPPRSQAPPDAAQAAEGATMPPRFRCCGSDRRRGSWPRCRTAAAASDGTGRMPAASLTRRRPAVDDDAKGAVSFSGSFSRLARRSGGARKCDRGSRPRAPRGGVGPMRWGAERRAGRATTHSNFCEFRTPRVLSVAAAGRVRLPAGVFHEWRHVGVNGD